MRALHSCIVVLLLSAAGCGRLGVQLFLLDLDAGMQPSDVGLQPTDAGRPRDAGGRAGSAGTSAAAGSGGAAVDGGRPYQGDASTPTDAGNPASCAGALQFDLCWYLAPEDTSCNSECSDKGGFDDRALNYVGTPSQGGSAQRCEQVLTALGNPGSVAIGTQQLGLGCHLWNNGDRWWLQSPTFTPTAATPEGTGAKIACACQN